MVSGAQPLMAAMEDYNHQVGLKIVGEMLPQEHNRVTLAEDKDQHGLPIARVEYSWCDNDRALIDHALQFMTQALQAIDVRDIWEQTDDTCHLNGTARMGDRSAHQRGRCGLPELGHSQSVDLRRVGVSHRRRCQSVADHPGDRLPHRRSHSRPRRAG